MAKTNFAPGTIVTADFLNAVNNPIFVATADNDGEIPLITNADLSNTPGQIKPEWIAFRDELKITAGSGLNVNYVAGSVTTPLGTIVAIPAGSLSLPNNTTSFVFVNESGGVTSSTVYPTTGLVIARVVTVGGAVSSITDLRPRYVVAGRSDIPLVPPEVQISNQGGSSTRDIEFSIGRVVLRNAANDRVVVNFTATIIKRIDLNWVAGTNQGGLDTGTVANNTYHCYVIYNPTTDARDALLSLSATSPTLPSGFTFFRRVGSITRVSGANRLFTQIGRYFQFPTRIRALDNVAVSTAGELIAMPVPTGIQVMINATFSEGLAASGLTLAVLVLDGNLTGTVAAAYGGQSTFDGTGGNLYNSGGSAGSSTDIWRLTNSAAQLYFRRAGSYFGVSNQTTLQIHGYEDINL
jgi:hypothetical protein